MQFSVKLTGVEEAMKRFDPKKVQTAARMALNSAARAGRTEAAKQIRKEWNLPAADTNRKTTLKLASTSDLRATLSIGSEPYILPYFKPQAIGGGVRTFLTRTDKDKGRFGLAGKKTRKADTGGIKVEIKRGKSIVLKNAFFQFGKGGTLLVFGRRSEKNAQGKQKLFAWKVYTAGSMFKKDAVMTPVKVRIMEQWNKDFPRLLNLK